MIIINYVRNCETIRKVKHYLKQKLKDTSMPIILCGICTQMGLDNIDDILKVKLPYPPNSNEIFNIKLL